MGFWKSLFDEDGGNEGQPPQDPAILFDATLRQSVARYTSGERSEAALEAVLPPPQPGGPKAASELFPAQFAEWTTVRSPWDRRGIVFAVLDELIGDTLAPWQRAERLVEDRRAQEAATVLGADTAVEGASKMQFCAAYAKTLICLGRPDEALVWGRRGLDAGSNDRALRTLVADAQHLLGNCDEAHSVYREMLPPTLFAQGARRLAASAIFDQLFSFEHGVVRSPVLAFSAVVGGDSYAKDLWPLVEDEFYYSPYFRAQHAYHLARCGDSMRAFSKLMALVQEMPWLEEATINCVQFLMAFDPDGSRGLCSDDRQRLTKTIEEQGWSLSNLKPLAPISFDLGEERSRMKNP